MQKIFAAVINNGKLAFRTGDLPRSRPLLLFAYYFTVSDTGLRAWIWIHLLRSAFNMRVICGADRRPLTYPPRLKQPTNKGIDLEEVGVERPYSLTAITIP